MPKIPLNLPNILTLYRIFAFPFILYALWAQMEHLFAWLICISLVTDILDGWIARAFNLQTEIGAKLDSIADMGTYIGAILGVFVFRSVAIQPYLVSFWTFIGLFVASHLLSVLKFGRFPSLHLYSWKIGGYIQGFFFFTLFVFDLYVPFYYLMVSWGIAAFTEHIIIQLIIPEMRSNAKGLYWVLKERKKAKNAF